MAAMAQSCLRRVRNPTNNGHMGTGGLEPIGNKWTFVKLDKRHENGKIARYKAWLVAQGFTQKPGTDFSNTGTFAPVMRFKTLHTLLAMSAIHDWELRQMDIKGAYLNGKIVEELYMQPTGFEDGTARVGRLRHKFNRTMREFSYTCLQSDDCAYIRRNGDAFLTWGSGPLLCMAGYSSPRGAGGFSTSTYYILE
jgi:hypothetical protein